ncbi:hypothetical protein Hypma_000481 [Hypsizygus marmoreus]|uniref:Uncharacterized protein n=1 Tax=Hypsizygus marmoreus TaxID=39966 RepID=A0A369JH73_HYPMA|nr:hypothetical protein Hypma_000481 [Hypsizygus marmoreus]
MSHLEIQQARTTIERHLLGESVNSPRTNAEIQNIAKLIDAHRGRIAQAHDDLPEPDPPANINAAANKKEKARLLFIKRTQQILAAADLPPQTMDEIYTTITSPPVQGRIGAEDAAFMRIFRGVESHSANEWEKKFHHLKVKPPTPQSSITEFQRYCNDAAKLEDILDDCDRHVSRNQGAKFIESSSAIVQGHHWVLTALQNIQTITFAQEWNKIGDEKGGKKLKTNFFIRAFQNANETHFKHLDDTQKASLMTELSGDFFQYRSTLYSKFGASILLDSFWDINNLGTKHEKKFRILFQHLANIQPQDEQGQKIDRLNVENRLTLRRLLRTIAGREVSKHVIAFIDKQRA